MIWRIATVVFFGAIGATLAVWTNDREPPIRIVKAFAVTKEVPPGGELRVSYEVQRFKSCRTHVDRILYDSENVRRDLDDIDFAAPPVPVGESSYIVGVTIPRNFAQGKAKYRTIWTYTCNPLQSMFSPVVVSEPDIEFKVEGEPVSIDESPMEVIPRR